MDEAKELGEGAVQDRECIRCKWFWTCAGKPKDVKECLNFKERQKDDKL